MKKVILLFACGFLSITIANAQSVVNSSNASSMAHFDDDDEPAFVFNVGAKQITPSVTPNATTCTPPASKGNNTEPSEDAVVVDYAPEFPGGVEGLWNFLASNIVYPKICQENGIQGRAIVEFVINKDGSVVEVEILRTTGDGILDEEAVRVVKLLPKFKPAIKDGKPIRVKMTIPINFRLQ